MKNDSTRNIILYSLSQLRSCPLHPGGCHGNGTPEHGAVAQGAAASLPALAWRPEVIRGVDPVIRNNNDTLYVSMDLCLQNLLPF